MIPTYYHGSSSASLPGVLDRQNPGLKPVGVILKEGNVPYSGELAEGIGKNGANLKVISVVPGYQLKHAVYYALNVSRQGWTPYEGERELEMLASPREKKNKYDPLLDRLQRMSSETLHRRATMLRRRIKKWENFSTKERELISAPFPVIYSVVYGGETIPLCSAIPDEVGIPQPVDLSDLVLYLPRRNTRAMRQLFQLQAEIRPLGGLHRLRGLPSDAYWSIDHLLGMTSR